MKIRLCIILLSIFFIGLGAFASTAPFRDGFSGIKWGAQISQLPAFEIFRKEGPVEFFRTPDKVYTIFEIDMDEVIFGFYEKKFFAAFAEVQSLDVFGKLKTHLTTAYGKPKIKLTMKTEQTIYQWKAEGVKVKLKVREKDGLMKLGVYFLEISKRVNEHVSDLYFEKSPQFFPIDREKRPERIPVLRF